MSKDLGGLIKGMTQSLEISQGGFYKKDGEDWTEIDKVEAVERALKGERILDDFDEEIKNAKNEK